MNDERSSNNGILTRELHEMVLNLIFGDSVFASDNVAEITNMSLLLSGRTMRLSEWVEMWPSSLASFGQVSVLVNVEAMLAWGQSFNFSSNLCLTTS